MTDVPPKPKTDAPTPQADALKEALELRPEVAAFAQLMEGKLRSNDHKPGWKGEDAFALRRRLHEESSELFSALIERETPERIGAEAADIANFAMMIADVSGALALSAPLQPGQDSAPSPDRMGDASYTDIFQSIAAATHVYAPGEGSAVGISVVAFNDELERRGFEVRAARAPSGGVTEEELADLMGNAVLQCDPIIDPHGPTARSSGVTAIVGHDDWCRAAKAILARLHSAREGGSA